MGTPNNLPQPHPQVPILVAFEVEKEFPPDDDGRGGGVVKREVVQACIFKVGDDCRQDILALQVHRSSHYNPDTSFAF